MKSILYAGAALMIGASVYGFVDYSNNSRNKEFKELYDEKTVTVPDEKPVPVKNEAKAVVTVPVEKKFVPVSKKNKKTEAEVKTPNKELVAPVEIIESGPAEVNTEALTESSTEKRYNEAKKKKKLSRKMFSRGGMREEYYIDEPVKKKKAVSKEL